MTANRSDRTLELVSAAYGAAIEPERFDKLLAAWDIWCDEHLHEAETAFEILSPKFEEAVSAATSMNSGPQVVSAIDATQAPLILLDAQEIVLAVNIAASSLIANAELDVDHLIRSRQRSDLEFGAGNLGAYRCSGAPGGRAYLAVEAPASGAIVAQHGSAAKMLMLSLIDWDEAFAADLSDRFGLSDAELRVARGLLEGRTAQEISGELERSVATIRSHIKALLQKSGARRQTEFVQLLTILRQAGARAAASEAMSEHQGDFTVTEMTGPAGKLSLVRYGAGRPALYFTTSSLPEETPELRAAFTAAGFEIIAPARPGFRGDARRTGDASDALLDDWLDHLVEAAGPDAVLIGHREGGILAAEAASRILRSGGAIRGLVLISTGAPALDIAEFENAPPTIKRSFRAARYALNALTLGYHTAARVFRSGQFGEDKIVEYFYRDSPVDARRMNEPRMRQITRDNIAYCFADPSQIARDVASWGADWSEHFAVAAAKVPVVFIHGSEHSFHAAGRIREIAARHERVSHLIIDNAAQLVIYEEPSKIADKIADLWSRDDGF
ncbi:MAG: alpha/beta fold hydrolase [Pseudomonadota bacterium]